MKHIITCILLVGMFACSSSKKVDTMAKSYEPIMEQDAQVSRITSMIQNDKKLDDERKKKLIDLVNEQARKITKVKKEQSQLRAVLIDQLLESSDGSNSATLATSKKLEDLNKKNIKALNNFIIKFRNISGEQEIRRDDFMREVGSIHFI